MLFKSSDYLGRLAKNSILITGVKYIRAPLGAKAIQLNKTFIDWNTADKLNVRTNFNGKEDPLADWTTDISQAEQGYFGKTAQGIESSEYLQFWIGFTTAYGSFYQFQLIKDATALWGSAIYEREQTVISGNSLSDLCTRNSVSVSPLESIIEGKRHCGVFIDIPLCEIDRQATATTPFYYRIPFDITFSGVLDLNQLNPIFNSFPSSVFMITVPHIRCGQNFRCGHPFVYEVAYYGNVQQQIIYQMSHVIATCHLDLSQGVWVQRYSHDSVTDGGLDAT
ncbi:MAG: hypothetical protein EZS28_029261 [Streblomastix strix]|uniref:Uncharacterized protein n=1 Tax=Streblomastix strix TaxID=222440 RepID=A0A5J4UYM5_9EUKA|nr:MAG: hypothetical protein EZS28_029261 [Streblomastix strix]